MSNSNPQSFVVLSDGMGKWRKGDVLAGSVLREAGADITRLLALKAIREATIHEAGSAHVEILSDGDRHLSQNHQVAEKEAEIARLTGRIASLEEQLATGNHLQKPGGSNLNESALIEEKDRAIRTLEGRVAALTQELATARIDAAAMRSELILAHAEANAAKSAAIETAKAESQKAADAVGAAKAKEDKKRKPADPALPPAPAPAPAALFVAGIAT
jgi:hypothetical protein